MLFCMCFCWFYIAVILCSSPKRSFFFNFWSTAQACPTVNYAFFWSNVWSAFTVEKPAWGKRGPLTNYGLEYHKNGQNHAKLATGALCSVTLCQNNVSTRWKNNVFWKLKYHTLIRFNPETYVNNFNFTPPKRIFFLRSSDPSFA